MSLFWAAVYGYFAFNYNDGPETCWFHKGDEPAVPYIEEDSDNYVDVHERFQIFFEGGFYIACGQAALYIISRIIDSMDLFRLIWNLIQLSNLVLFVLWVYAFVVRFLPSGRYCSGDNTDGDKSGYLYAEGMFIKVCFIIFVALIVLAIIANVWRRLTK
uniref:Uncharacterized protein n=1 Tax=Strombidinopsis acuminata TaxID=141414 RepID=A0A7S3RY15_9SPIT|mmetsp:Transcript_15337/g.20763  ORF Transcript_15337/g.20763 Transcript_15337/m.20763 type:complete len:159 (+) Transcript_15337:59-535(+)